MPAGDLDDPAVTVGGPHPLGGSLAGGLSGREDRGGYRTACRERQDGGESGQVSARDHGLERSHHFRWRWVHEGCSQRLSSIEGRRPGHGFRFMRFRCGRRSGIGPNRIHRQVVWLGGRGRRGVLRLGVGSHVVLTRGVYGFGVPVWVVGDAVRGRRRCPPWGWAQRCVITADVAGSGSPHAVVVPDDGPVPSMGGVPPCR
jgi:hypothetical protein